MRFRAVLPILVAICAFAPVADAGQRFTIDHGTDGADPHVVVEPDNGTAHVVWLEGNTTMECNVPRGAASCSAQPVNMGLPADKPEADTPWILRAADGTLYIFMARYVRNDAYLSRSTDGGATWSTGMPIYKVLPGQTGIVGTHKGDPVLFPDQQVTIASFNGGGNVFAARLDGAEAGGGPTADLQEAATSDKFDIQAVPTPDGGMIAVAWDGPGYFWTMTPGADPSATGSWGPPVQFTPATDETSLAAGASGVYALTDEPGGSFRHVLIRKFGAGSFGAPVEAESVQGYLADLTEAPAGIVAGVWRANGSPNRLRFSRSTDGSAFTTQTILLAKDIFFDLDVSVANDGKGFAVWKGDDKTINMTSTDPVVDENAPPGTGTTIIEYPNATITLGGVKGCVNPGGKTTVRLGFKRKKKKGNVWIKVFRVDFSQDGKLLKKVTKPPFKRTIKVKATQPKGSFIEVRARAFIKVHHGKTPKKSVRVRIPVCP